jgi:hypothetical protein
MIPRADRQCGPGLFELHDVRWWIRESVVEVHSWPLVATVLFVQDAGLFVRSHSTPTALALLRVATLVTTAPPPPAS